VAKRELEAKLEELRKLAVGSRRKLTEIANGITLIRGEINEVNKLLGDAPADGPEEAEREFEELSATRARISRHDA
jgi:hypothetical protein